MGTTPSYHLAVPRLSPCRALGGPYPLPAQEGCSLTRQVARPRPTRCV